MKESEDVGRAQENVEALKQQLADLEAQIETEVADLAARIDPADRELEPLALKPKKTNITVRLVALTWAPHLQDAAAI